MPMRIMVPAQPFTMDPVQVSRQPGGLVAVSVSVHLSFLFMYAFVRRVFVCYRVMTVPSSSTPPLGSARLCLGSVLSELRILCRLPLLWRRAGLLL